MATNTSTSHTDMIARILADKAIISFANMTPQSLVGRSVNVGPQLKARGGKILDLPFQRAVTSGNHTEGTADTAAIFSAGTRSLTVNVNKSVPFEISAELSTWQSVDVVPGILAQIVPLFLKNMATSIGALYTSAGEVVSGVTSAYITEAQIAEAKRKLVAAGALAAGGELWLTVDSKNYEAMTKIARFTENQMIGNGSAIETGVVGRIHGFNVYMDDTLTAASGKRHCLAGVRPREDANWPQASLVHAVTEPAPSQANVTQILLPGVGMITIGRATLAAVDQYLGHQLYGVAVARPEWLVDIETAD